MQSRLTDGFRGQTHKHLSRVKDSLLTLALAEISPAPLFRRFFYFWRGALP
jgi:hypothetical protein